MAAKVFFVPKLQQERRDLNKKIRDEQKPKPSFKTQIVNSAKAAPGKIKKAISRELEVAPYKLRAVGRNLKKAIKSEMVRISDNVEREMARTPSAKGTWLNPLVVKKKKKSKKVK